jgi:hypothetical protein
MDLYDRWQSGNLPFLLIIDLPSERRNNTVVMPTEPTLTFDLRGEFRGDRLQTLRSSVFCHHAVQLTIESAPHFPMRTSVY